jgi:hypothetical protein
LLPLPTLLQSKQNQCISSLHLNIYSNLNLPSGSTFIPALFINAETIQTFPSGVAAKIQRELPGNLFQILNSFVRWNLIRSKSIALHPVADVYVSQL